MIRYCLLVLSLAGALPAQERSHTAPADAPSQLRIAARGEPGQSLRITGVIVDEAGHALSGASVYVYQTDARGYYTPERADNNRQARIHGWLRADRNGRFEIATVRPGSYPSSRVPQHVHLVVNATGFAERIFEIVFDDDPFVDARVRAEAARPNSMFSICRPQSEGNGLHCAERVQLTRS
jgi:protocatechuate 3,4-dioxygenase beta subunit